MIVCPICENQQPHGGECDVCGKRLDGPPAPGQAVPPMEGLEPTRAEPVDADGEAFADLEPTGYVGEAVVFPDAMPDFERTAAAPVTVAAEELPDIERIEAGIPGDAPTVLPAIAVCRYCRTPAAGDERICGRCGMRLPVPPGQAAPGPAAPARLCSCGTPVRGSLCPACGARTSAN